MTQWAALNTDSGSHDPVGSSQSHRVTLKTQWAALNLIETPKTQWAGLNIIEALETQWAALNTRSGSQDPMGSSQHIQWLSRPNGQVLIQIEALKTQWAGLISQRLLRPSGQLSILIVAL